MTKVEWLPISSAPADREFLGFDSRTKLMDVCECRRGINGLLHVSQVQEDGEWGAHDSEFGNRKEDITHWVDLPEAPHD